MTKLNIIILSLSIVLLSTSCLKEINREDFLDDSISMNVSVKVVLPDNLSLPLGGTLIELSDLSSGIKLSGLTDDEGVVKIRVPFGTYTAIANKSEATSGGVILIFNGSSDRIKATPIAPENINVELPLNVSQTGQIVIKEFYYGGKRDSNNKNYFKDQYFILYNNSNSVAYLDSLCVGITNPMNAPTSGKLSQWVKGETSELRDSIPTSTLGWMFPGSGKSVPLNPGEEIVVCLNAINHEGKVPTAVNLGNPNYWALYNTKWTTMHSYPVAGVEMLEAFWKIGKSKAYTMSISSPALFLYSLGGKNTKDFVESTLALNPNYATNRNFDCLLVDKNLILDGVECFRNDTDTKRLRPEIDNGYIRTAGSGSGESVHRKVDEAATAKAGGRIVYVDTNNSSNDFEVRSKPSLKK